MSDRYNRPEAGTTDWHTPLNENFTNIGADVDTIEGQLDSKAELDHDHSGETIVPAELTGDVVSRFEPITSLSGNVFVVEEGADDPTEHDGDIVFYI